MDSDGKNVLQLTKAPGCYNGGPFFSPDGKRVIFRSDRKKPDHLQLYVIDVDCKNKRELTSDLDWVQWGPFWYGDSKHITHYPGADVLPVFSPDGKRMMWTSTRTKGC